MLTLIAAISRDHVIGHGGKLPWHVPEDIKHFKELTTGHVVVMGRKTWESIPKKYRPLPNRTNVVVTRQQEYRVPEGVLVFSSIDEALNNVGAREANTVFIIGGAEIYHQTIDRADRLEITHVNQDVDGDAFFPKINPAMWLEVSRDIHDGFSFARYSRIR
ncbi:MAG: dihydrofolate reductase [Patescibacteria group bacterium]